MLIWKKNFPHKEDISSEVYKRLDKSYFQEPPELQIQVDTGTLV